MSGYGEALEGLGTTESGQLRHAFEQLGNGCFAVNKSLDVEVRHFLPSPACAERRASCTASENGVTRFSRIPSSPLCSSLGLTPRFIWYFSREPKTKHVAEGLVGMWLLADARAGGQV